MKLFKTYFQKSKVFLYPLLGIAKGARYVPVETYMSWTDNHLTGDMKLCCVYKQQRTKTYLAFEEKNLLKNKKFFDYRKLDDGTHLYIFDLSNYPQTWLAVLDGMYSKIRCDEKEIILDFFGDVGVVAETIESYLYPEDYHEDYADKLDVDIECIQKVHEVCDAPNIDKETLVKNSTVIQVIKKDNVSLPEK